MASNTLSSRNPYPFPKVQNDADFYGPTFSEKEPYKQATHLAQNEDPWNRLNSKCTLSSSRREVFHFDPQAPKDSLDFILKSEYDHHDEFLRAKNETLYQPESKGSEHGRVLKNREIEIVPVKPYLCHPLHITDQKKKDSIHTIENAIESSHSDGTNGGYSRKHDGGFYCT
ncbi:protein CFAP276-like isoform X2 [Mytilus galloprovincialis]|uniref:Uncharacterized protein n=1 Tax=Mytilus galloprovincialis TaxID=29158 RepID=A0A8B6GUZ7_MYTGA|nr:Hypothetical predicted protein [Mytilus galloprovincialis]